MRASEGERTLRTTFVLLVVQLCVLGSCIDPLLVVVEEAVRLLLLRVLQLLLRRILMRMLMLLLTFGKMLLLKLVRVMPMKLKMLEVMPMHLLLLWWLLQRPRWRCWKNMVNW